ncbi:peptidoglycan hydrolase PcsB [Streptococcus phocae subsp. phocae]
MKKRILSAVLVSGITLGTATTVGAEDFQAKIVAKDLVISNLNAQQRAAQKQVLALEKEVSSLQSEQDKLATENTQLNLKSVQFEQEIQALASQIVARNEKLDNQARSAQKNRTTQSYINALLNSKSISDAITRLVAINRAISANAKMLEQQKSDKLTIVEKQKANQLAINTIATNMEAIEANQNALKTQQADLKVATVNLALELTTAENEKATLLSQKAEAEKAAAQAKAEAERAAAEKAAQASAQAQSVQRAQAAAVTFAPSTPAATPAPSAMVAAPVVSRPQVSYSSGNTYPIGQCTWGAKSLAPWVGNNWGNANQWGASARAAGHSTGSTPVVGSVIVWPNDGNGYGHVAYVTSVSGSTITVMESNYSGNQSIGDYRGSFDVNASGSHYFIYR